MIYCNNFIGQFGNQVLTLNNIIQLGILCDTSYNINNFKYKQYFNIINSQIINSKDNTININSRDIIDIFNNKKKYNKEELIELSKNKNINLKQPCLGELFFEYNCVNINNYIQIKDKYNIKPNDNYINIAIHIRKMPDDWCKNNNIKTHLTEEYYINSIKEILNNFHLKPLKFIIFGAFNKEQFSNNENNEISNYKPLIETIKYLNNNKIDYEYCYTKKNNNDNFIYDFSQMSNCDILISSISTFSICAGFLGKLKYIIHNKEWIEWSINRNDKFWVDLYNNKNEIYKIWKLI